MYDELMGRLRAESNLPYSALKDMHDAADAIEELQGRAKVLEKVTDKWCEAVPKWIPVTERLPEIDMSYPHHEDYLVQYDSGNIDVASWSNVKRFWTVHVTEPHWNCVQFAEVIAWMPLPKPPKGERKDDATTT